MEGKRRLGHAASWRKERSAVSNGTVNGTPSTPNEAAPMEEVRQQGGEADNLIRRCQEFIRDQGSENRDPMRQLLRATVSVLEDHVPKLISSTTKQLEEEVQSLRSEVEAMAKQRAEDKEEIERLQLELKSVKADHVKEQRRLKEVLSTFLDEGN